MTPTGSATLDQTETLVDISVREARLVVERLLVVAGFPIGVIPPLRDYILDAQTLGLNALPYLRDHFGVVAGDARRDPLTYDGNAAVVSVAAGDRSGLSVGPDVLDLAIGTAARWGVSCLHVTDLREARFLDAVVVSAARQGCSALVLPARIEGTATISYGQFWDQSVRLRGRPAETRADSERLVVCVPGRRPGPQVDRYSVSALGPHLLDALDHGFLLNEDLWWWLYHESGAALTPDSPLSRQHTGASVLDTYGNIVGEVGEDLEEA